MQDVTKLLHDSENIVGYFGAHYIVFILKKIIWNERPDNATFSVAKSITFPIFGNADTQSADHRKPIFTHM